MAEGPSLCSIPPELLLHVLSYVDEEPRSKSDVYDQPTLNIISSRYKHPPLKSLSRTCRGFRQLLFSRLFRHTLHLVTADERNAERGEDLPICPEWPASKLHAFLNFIEDKHLRFVVRSFTLAIKAQPEWDPLEYFHDERTEQATLYGRHWEQLLQNVLPLLERVTIIAPPTVLGVLTAVEVPPAGLQALHIPYQILSLWRHSIPTWQPRSIENVRKKKESSSLFRSVPWTNILINEGSFLRAHDDSRAWINNMFISDEFTHTSIDSNYFPHVTSFCYVGLWVHEDHVAYVVRFAASIPLLQVFQFALQSTIPLLGDPSQQRPISQRRLAAEMQNSYPELMHLFTQAQVAADYLGLDSCFNYLYRVECVDPPSLISFDHESEVPEGWSWLWDDPGTHVLTLTSYRHLH